MEDTLGQQIAQGVFDVARMATIIQRNREVSPIC